MKQLTTNQAVDLAKSGTWKNWSNEEIVRFQLFQKKLCVDFRRFHEALESVLGRPVYTHELGTNYEGIVLEYLGEKEPPTMDEIIHLMPENIIFVVTK